MNPAGIVTTLTTLDKYVEPLTLYVQIGGTENGDVLAIRFFFDE